MSRGRHTLQFGGVVQRNGDGRIDDTTNTFKYSSLSDFDNDIPSQIKINFPLTQFELHTFQFGGYMQDAYRVSPSLTLNFGMRYDYFTVPKERDGRIFIRDASSMGPGTGTLRPPSQMYQSYWPNFSPRVRFAYSLGSNRNTVVRGGFGVFYNPHTIYGGPIDDILDNPYVPFRLTLNRSQALAMGLNFPVNKQAVEQGLISQQVPVATTAIDDYFPNDSGRTWSGCDVPGSGGIVQMNIIRPSGGGQLVAFFRSRYADWIYSSRSADGCHWDAPAATTLPNNNSSIQAVRLKDGHIVIVFNNAQGSPQRGGPGTGSREVLSVALSTDDGKTWPSVRDVQGGVEPPRFFPCEDPEYSYPSIVQSAGGKIRIAFTFRRETIKYMTFEESWIKQGTTVGVKEGKAEIY